MPEKLLKVKSVKICYTKHGKEYKLIRFQQILVHDNGKEESMQLSGERTFWPEKKAITVVDKVTKVIRKENWREYINYENVTVNDYFAGEIIEFPTTPFKEAGEIKTSFDSVLIEGDKDYLKTTARELRYLGKEAAPLDNEGKVYIYKPSKVEIENLDLDYGED